MSFDLTPKNQNAKDEEINQLAWPPIWRWLCQKHGNLSPEFVRGGFFNDGLSVSSVIAERFAEILEENPEGGPWELGEYARILNEGTRAERLIRFFRASGGFEIW